MSPLLGMNKWIVSVFLGTGMLHSPLSFALISILYALFFPSSTFGCLRMYCHCRSTQQTTRPFVTSMSGDRGRRRHLFFGGGGGSLATFAICKGYRLRWRSDTWRTDRGVAEVRSPGIRPATDDDIRHNAPGLLETVDQLLRTEVRRKLLNQDKPSRLASYALQQHKAKSARLAASEFSSLLAVLRRSRWVRAVEQG